MVFLCHYRNKLIFGLKAEGGRGAGATCVSRRKRRDVTAAGVLKPAGSVAAVGVCTTRLSV